MKKIIFCFLTFILTAIALKIDGGATLKGGKNYEFYYKCGGAVPKVEKMAENSVLFGVSAAKKEGESCVMTEEEFEKLLADLRAKEVFREKGDDFDNVYYFSPFINDFVYAGGKKANIHVAKKSADGTMKVATPINFGGY